MNKETMWEAMEHLAPDLIEEADRPAAPRRRRFWGKTLLIAAAACLVLAVGVFLLILEIMGARRRKENCSMGEP